MSEIAAPAALAAKTVWHWRRQPAADDRARAAAAARRKGALGGVIGLLVASGLFFWKPRLALVVAAIAVATTLLAVVSPLGGFRRFAAVLDAFGRAVGLAMTWLLMTLAYYGLFLPVGLFLRLGGKLHITRGADAARASYWEPSRQPAPGLDTYRKSF